MAQLEAANYVHLLSFGCSLLHVEVFPPTDCYCKDKHTFKMLNDKLYNQVVGMAYTVQQQSHKFNYDDILVLNTMTDIPQQRVNMML